jgi:chromosome segregation protein
VPKTSRTWLRRSKGSKPVDYGLKAASDDLQSNWQPSKHPPKQRELNEQQMIINRLNTELITVKTRQEQYQTFIENSRTVRKTSPVK